MQAATGRILNWLEIARPKQRLPGGVWDIWLLMAGRGFGKTRVGSEDAILHTTINEHYRYAVVCATRDDVRRTAFEGESGILTLLPSNCISKYNKQLLEIELWNGSLIQGFTAQEPDRLRGPQFHRALCDEFAAWRYRETWDNLRFALRLGDAPKTLITTTPKRNKQLMELVKQKGVHITTGSTFENEDNLAPGFISAIKERYEGTRIGRQEIYAELLKDVEGALWTLDMIEGSRLGEHPSLNRIVVAIDPAVTAHANSSETGIVVVGRDQRGHCYVLDDLSGRYSPNEWARKAIGAYHQYQADAIIGEVNNGGDLVEHTIRTVDDTVNYKAVRASRGKATRAEPVAALYEQNKVHHIGALANLEDQMTTWSPQDDDSPDRLDAVVWGITDLSLTPQLEIPRVGLL